MSLRFFYDDLCESTKRVTLIPDEALVELAKWQVLEKEHAILRGEILFRVGWLYRNGTCPDVLREAFEGILNVLGDPLAGSLRGLGKSDCPPVRADDFPEFGRLAEGPWFFARMQDFASAHGIIPVVRFGEAFPLFFRILRKADSPSGCFTDQDGLILSEWESNAEGLWNALGNEHYTVRVQVPEGVPVEGASFALPVYLAVKGSKEWAREILATGAIRNGRVENVDHCNTKAALALKLGTRFWLTPTPAPAFPAELDGTQIHVAPGTEVNTALEMIRQAMGLWTPPADIRSATQILEDLQRSAEGRISIEELRSRIGACIRMLEDHGGAHLKSKIRDARVFLATMENHAGNAKGAVALLQRILDEGKENVAIVGKAMASHVVSLVDMGRLREGEELGRLLLRRLEESKGSLEPEVYLSLKMQATGALGGEALMHQALRTGDSVKAEESHRLLSDCLDHARELRQGFLF